VWFSSPADICAGIHQSYSWLPGIHEVSIRDPTTGEDPLTRLSFREAKKAFLTIRASLMNRLDIYCSNHNNPIVPNSESSSTHSLGIQWGLCSTLVTAHHSFTKPQATIPQVSLYPGEIDTPLPRYRINPGMACIPRPEPTESGIARLASLESYLKPTVCSLLGAPHLPVGAGGVV
jgi:hypothetical protein